MVADRLRAAYHRVNEFRMTARTLRTARENIGSSHLDLHAFQLASERGLLGVRMTVMPYLTLLHPIGSGMPDQEWYGLDLGIRTGLGDDRLRIGPAKVLSDGSLIGRSAAMRCCYADEPENLGFLQWAPETLTGMLVAAHASGWQLAAHAIGDAAIDLALDAFELAQRRHPRPDVRHRIEHFAVADDRQVARAAALGIVPVPQGRFVSELGDGMLAALGPEPATACGACSTPAWCCRAAAMHQWRTEPRCSASTTWSTGAPAAASRSASTNG